MQRLDHAIKERLSDRDRVSESVRQVFGFAELMPAHRLHASGAHLVFDNMIDLPELIDGA